MGLGRVRMVVGLGLLLWARRKVGLLFRSVLVKVLLRVLDLNHHQCQAHHQYSLNRNLLKCLEKPTTSNLNHSPANHGRPARQKSVKRDGRDNLQVNGVFSHQPLSPAQGSHNRDKPATGGGSECSVIDSIQNHGHRDSWPWNGSGDHHQPRHSHYRGSGGSQSREGSHQNTGRRGNQDWNRQRSFNGRSGTIQARVSPRGLSSPTTPFVHLVAMQPTFMKTWVWQVKLLTDNIQQILDAVRSSTVVQVQGDKIRKRDDWMRWKMPPSVQFPIASSSQSPKSPTVGSL